MLIHSVVAGKPARRGAVTVWMLVCLIVLIGMLAIGMDGGRMLEKRRHAQATADGAALAAAASLFQIDLTQNGMATGKKKDAAQSAALSLAAANGFNNDGTTSTVTVNTPPNSGVFTGQTDYVEVIVQYNLSKSFGAIFTKNNLPVTARAVAVGRPLQLGILVLAQSGSNAFLNASDGDVTLVNSYLFVNSSDPAAFSQTGSGSITAVTFDITGNYTNSGGGSIQGPIRTGVRRTPDPLLSLPAPNAGSLTVQSSGPLDLTSAKKATIQPGIYKGGITIGGSADITMAPGTYVLQGGGLQVSGQGSLSGNNVLIYNTSGTMAAGPISILTGGSINLSPSSSGTYQGVSIFQDRSVSEILAITGNGGTNITGLVYAPNATVILLGLAKKKNAADTLGGAFICNIMQIWGRGDFNIDPGNNPILTVPELALEE